MKIAIVNLETCLIVMVLLQKNLGQVLKKKIIVTILGLEDFMSGEEASNLIISALQIIFKSRDQKLCELLYVIWKPVKIEV